MKKGDRLRFNVGGRIFETTAMTLAAAGPDSFFGPLISDDWNTNTDNEADDNDGEVFIDRNPDYFSIILDLLRTGELSVPPHVSKDSLIREAQFYGVVELVRAASWASPLNGDFALPSSSVTCRAKPKAAKMVFGSPNGGFCIANDTSVHVYDWILREHPPIFLEDHGRVNDVLWVGTNNIVISTTETVSMFNAATGKLKYNFICQSGNHVKGATSMCLSDTNIFYLYQTNNENRVIGMLDLESGKLIDSLSLCLPTYLSDISYNPRLKVWRPINLQKVDGSGNCLLATHVFCPYGAPGKHSFEAQIIDTRDSRHSVYNRSWASGNYDVNNTRKMIRATTVMEDRNSLCVINNDGEIGFLDLRFTGDVQWGSKKEGGQCSPSDRIKLAYQSDRIFRLSGTRLLVYTVPNLVMTSEIPRNGNGDSRFNDFSISGDRLFVLHGGTSLVDVWETPRPSCLTIL